ncbi:hypothetical protein M5689_024487 [Euphorbia peplus]|nr:hypothetical protein M5689_024487 [Euphorbia peplus]
MRCLFTCFTASKSKHNKRIHIFDRDVAAVTPPLQSTTLQIPLTPNPQEKKLEEEQLNSDLKVLYPQEGGTDKVGQNEVEMGDNEQQFDHDDSRNLVEEESSGSLFSLSIDSTRPTSRGEKVTSFDDVDDSNDSILVEAESSESLFSLSIDSRKLISCGGELGEKEVSSPIPKCSRETDQNQTRSVLTPLENQNLPQLKTVKAKFHHQDKENINSQQDNASNTFSFELLSKKERVNRHEKKLSGKEIAVETSLSSWLIQPETTALAKGSSNSVGNSVNGGGESSPRSSQSRHVLGALTMRQCPGSTTTTTTPTRRNSLSSDDTSNVGTVGSYWRHTGRRLDSGSSASSRRMQENVKKNVEVIV